MTDSPLSPGAAAADEGVDDDRLGRLTVEDGADGAGPTAAAPADDYQADEAHDWTGGSGR